MVLLACLCLILSMFLAAEAADFEHLRAEMVRSQIADRGVKDPRVLAAMKQVPRHLFVPEALRSLAYTDNALPLAEGQTISQPYIVAVMSEALALKPDDRVLEIGTGSGYQAAVLAQLTKEVYTIEIIEPLAKQATESLRMLGYKNVYVRLGDGYQGWPEKAPFDAIIVTAAPPEIPRALVQQLKEGGRLIVPVGDAGSVQKLIKAVKHGTTVRTEELMPVRFVPMVRPSGTTGNGKQ
nr:protein-L-isoaspartate(D-aspartate) O-methyltransferase [Deltaproteobacteria bacterium]